jgi:hypothetical protein
MSDRRFGWLAIALGAGLALAVQLAAPVGVPLYDGVVVVEPYRFLRPSGGQPGNPTSFVSEPKVDTSGVSPVIAAATTESPPQAQLIAQRNAFAVPGGTSSLRVTITPVEAEAAPTDGAIAGNVYRFAATDASGRSLVAKRCEKCLSLVLRAPEGVDEAVIGHFVGGAWSQVATVHAGIAAMFQANITELGDYAVVTSVPLAGGGPDLVLILAGLGVALIFAAFVGLMFIRARPPAAYPTNRGGGRARVPSKRRGRRPPPGRPES